MTDTTELILINDDYFSALLKDIDAAKICIQLETYIFDLDDIGKKILSALMSAAMRGVDVFLLLDGFGTSQWSQTYCNEFEAAGGKIKIYHPLPWMFTHWKHGAAHLPTFIGERLIYLITHINSRNHRKICLIDKKIAYIGSANITAYPKNLSPTIKWHDMTVRYEGNISELSYIFALAWGERALRVKAYQALIQSDYFSPFQLNYSWRIRRMIYKRLLFQLKNAKKRIWIINPYFIPNRAILTRLKKRAKAHVDVRILIPAISDVPGLTLLQRNFYAYLLKSPVTIMEYTPEYILHAKILMIDDWFCVGSSNLNYRSFHRDLEADLIIQGEAAKEDINKQVEHYFTISKKITKSDINKEVIWKKIIGKILFLISYWF